MVFGHDRVDHQRVGGLAGHSAPDRRRVARHRAIV
jgi:hypothetical protein